MGQWKDVLVQFDEAVTDARMDDSATILFVATDGERVYKAFTGPKSAIGQSDPEFFAGLDDNVFIGIWSHQWLMNMIRGIESMPDPDDEWNETMQRMMLSLVEFADADSSPVAGNC